jgi:hypothetical protein
MSTTKEEIARWFDAGKRQKARWMVVACDTFDHTDYPIYVKPGEDVKVVVKEHDNESKMSRVMEVYSYELDRDVQLGEHLAWHLD